MVEKRPRGRPPTGVHHKRLTISLDDWLVASTDAEAARRGLTRSDLIRVALAELLQRANEDIARQVGKKKKPRK